MHMTNSIRLGATATYLQGPAHTAATTMGHRLMLILFKQGIEEDFPENAPDRLKNKILAPHDCDDPLWYTANAVLPSLQGQRISISTWCPAKLMVLSAGGFQLR
jgi:hypothetical protein